VSAFKSPGLMFPSYMEPTDISLAPVKMAVTLQKPPAVSGCSINKPPPGRSIEALRIFPDGIEVAGMSPRANSYPWRRTCHPAKQRPEGELLFVSLIATS
jgi:hypothetical protein